jgi:hypothetical protein
MRLDVSMHDAFRVTEIESFEELKDVVPDVKVCEFGIEGFEFRVLKVSFRWVRLSELRLDVR